MVVESLSPVSALCTVCSKGAVSPGALPAGSGILDYR